MAKKTTTKAKKGSQASDQRRDARVPLKARVDYELLSEDTFLFEYTSNLSRGGIFLATRNPLPIGTHLSLRFTLPENGRIIDTNGQVAWINEYRPGGDNINPGMGIEFTDLNDEDREAIANLVKRKALLTE
ncbi:MAG: TIGR02266 family protein [Candidatus Lernaella stagnicola]|nr:TIGR02266 family protein [Candidatus Lernaella stagnicola]